MDRRQFLVVSGHGIGAIGLAGVSGCALFDHGGSKDSTALGASVAHASGDEHTVFHEGQPAFVIDHLGHQVHDVAGAGSGSALEASARITDLGLNTPLDAQVGPDGNTYVLDHGNGRVVVFDPDGRELRAIGEYEVLFPQDFAVQGDEVWICDTLEHQVHVYGTDGAERMHFGEHDFGEGLNGPCSIAFDGAGRAHVLALGSGEVHVFDSDGTRVDVYAGIGGDIQRPRSLAILADGRVCLADPPAGLVHVFTTEGEHLGDFVPTDRDGAPAVPVRLSLMPDGGLYVWTKGLRSFDA